MATSLRMYPFERLAAWQVAYELTLATYRATRDFPKHELYGLTSQSRRAAVSVIANIAEGSAKRGEGELRRFLDIALGSIYGQGGDGYLRALEAIARHRDTAAGGATDRPDAASAIEGER